MQARPIYETEITRCVFLWRGQHQQNDERQFELRGISCEFVVALNDPIHELTRSYTKERLQSLCEQLV
jgi:hypothetical protein